MEEGQIIGQIEAAFCRKKRIIRWFLLAGFILMLALETWLIMQVWNLWA